MELIIAYIGLTTLMSIILILFGFWVINKSFPDPKAQKRKKSYLVSGIILWHIYVYLISISGILQNLEFPPRFFIFLVLPLFIFIGVFMYKNRNNAWIQNVPKTWPVYYQSFRILIETVFVFTVAAGFLHKEVTMEGYNYDVLFGLSAPLVGLLYQKNKLSNKSIIIWNYIGLAVIAFIIFLFLSTVFAPHLYGSNVALMPMEAVTYPYTLVAGFLMPSAVFIHVLSIVQLRKSKEKM